MLKADLKSKINQLWDKFWSGGISNPLSAIEQMSYLIFMKRLEDLDNQHVKIAEARGETRKTTAFATSLASMQRFKGEFCTVYSIIFSINPMAFAALEPYGPAEIAFTRMPKRLPASKASVFVSLSKAAFAELIPPP